MLTRKTYHIPDLILYIFRRIPFHAAGTILLMILEALLPAAQTLAIANFVDAATDFLQDNAQTLADSGSAPTDPVFPISAQPLVSAMLPILLCLFASNVLPVLSEFLLTAGKQRLHLALRQEVTGKRSRLAFSHVENHADQDLADRISRSPETRFLLAFQNAAEICRLLLTVISILAIIMKASPLSGAAILLVSVPFYKLALKTGSNSYEMHRDAQKIQRRYQYLADVLTRREYAEERTLFGCSPSLREKYDQLYDQSYKIEKRMQIKSYCNLKSGSVITLFLALLIIALLLRAFLTGNMTLGTLTALTGAVWDLVQSMSWQLSDAMFFLAHSREFCKDLTAFMALEEKKDAAAPPADRSSLIFQSLEFRDVSFRYPNSSKKILDHCSFKLENGHQYAFVGENGAGKTTIVKLLLGLYDDYTGQILLNGQDIRTLPYGELKGYLAVVSQDFSRYELTIRENILLGSLSDENAAARLSQALAQSGLAETMANLPAGIETPLGRLTKQSADMSGGQWQRLAIARLLCAHAPINILDEPTAALDPFQESRLYRTFQETCRNSFAIYITHRLGAARIADRILVLADGHVAESGSHDALMRLEKGRYRQMYESQRSWYE